MPLPTTRSRIAPAVLGALVVGCLAAAARPASAQDVPRILYVSALDNKTGKPIADMQPADFEVKIGGKKAEIVRVEPAQAPLRVAVIVADGGTGGFQQGLAHFMQRLLGHAEIALISLIVQPELVTDYASEGAVLKSGLQRLGPRGRQRGAQLMEAIRDVAKNMRSEGRRPVIVVTRVGAEATTALPPDEVRNEVRKSGAILYVISTLGAQRAAPSMARTGISTEQAQMQDADIKDDAFNLAQVLGDGSKESGGRHDQVVSTTLVPVLEQLAEELRNQYVLAWAMPSGAKTTDKLSITSRRKGVRVHAPTRLAQ